MKKLAVKICNQKKTERLRLSFFEHFENSIILINPREKYFPQLMINFSGTSNHAQWLRNVSVYSLQTPCKQFYCFTFNCTANLELIKNILSI